VRALNALRISGAEVLPLIEGGKGIGVSNGRSSGAWSAAGGVGTFSGVNADSYDENGKPLTAIYRGKTRNERHEELIGYSIQGGIAQAKIAHDVMGGRGRLHMNVLWEMGGAERVLHGIMEGAKGLIHGITCGAGMPYRLGEIAARYSVYYYPIISSARAFNALWKRAYSKVSEWLGGVVYEDPWLAGGHNGLSNSEDPRKPEAPYPRIVLLRKAMNEFGLHAVPIIMAGGVWYLRDFEKWLDDPEVGPIAFQFGTRPLLTKESPISDAWKARLLELKEGDVLLQRFSPTGFWSSAVRNKFIVELEERSHRQIAFTGEPLGEHDTELAIGARGRLVYVTAEDKARARAWMAEGFTEAMRTPDSTLVFATPEKAEAIRRDQVECMGCLSQCGFSNWATNEKGTTGKKADPRSFCIQKTLQSIIHTDRIDDQLMFSGHGAFKFRTDPFYSNGFVPTVKQLVERIATGD